MSDRTKVLLTEGSSSSARQALYSLSNYLVDVVDPAPLCQCRFSSLVSKWYRCPRYSEDPAAYVSFLAQRIAGNDYDVLLPTHEQVYLLSYFREAFSKRVGLAVPDFEAVRRTQSKVEFAKLLEELNLSAPATRVISSRGELDSVKQFPCFLKLAHSTAGMGVKPVNNESELKQAYDQFVADGMIEHHAEVLVQQPAQGTPGVVQSVFQHGRLLAAHCSEPRLVGLGGGQMIRVSARHPSVREDLEQFGDHLGWHGALFLDYFQDADTGRIEYVEANPRLGETLSARLSGVNLCKVLVEVSLGHTLDPAGITEQGVWSHNGFQVLLARAIQGANRRRLISEAWQLARGTGVYENCENETTRLAEDWMSFIPATAVFAQLLFRPKLASHIVDSTVRNYALPAAGVQRIESLPRDLAESCFEGLHAGGRKPAKNSENRR